MAKLSRSTSARRVVRAHLAEIIKLLDVLGALEMSSEAHAAFTAVLRRTVAMDESIALGSLGMPYPIPAAWIVPGAHAQFHPIIGQIASRPVTVTGRPFQTSINEHWSVFVDGVSGSVACDALTEATAAEGGS